MKNTKIEYCSSTWNPVTGCYHGCEYCYARNIAHRFSGCIESPTGTTDKEIVYLKEPLKRITKKNHEIYAAYPFDFTPTFHEYRLSELKCRKYGDTIFVCSTSDLFGSFIPEEWIMKVFDACKDSEEHIYLFLTKNPARYLELAKKGLLPENNNFWYGSTMATESAPVFYSDKHNTFTSIEPILGPFSDTSAKSIASKTNWAIFGAETGNRLGKVVPKVDWIKKLVEDLLSKNVPVFMKNSMIPIWGDNIITQTPWSNDHG